jgi:uncharacterized membrane protein YebE (DUF533 family)
MTNQTATSETACKQNTSQVNNITNALAQLMGIKVVQASTTTTKVKSDDDATSKNVKKGLGDLISSILGFFSGTFGMIIVAVLVLCCLGLSGYSIYSKMSSNSASQQQSQSQDPNQGNSTVDPNQTGGYSDSSISLPDRFFDLLS